MTIHVIKPRPTPNELRLKKDPPQSTTNQLTPEKIEQLGWEMDRNWIAQKGCDFMAWTTVPNASSASSLAPKKLHWDVNHPLRSTTKQNFTSLFIEKSCLTDVNKKNHGFNKKVSLPPGK